MSKFTVGGNHSPVGGIRYMLYSIGKAPDVASTRVYIYEVEYYYMLYVYIYQGVAQLFFLKKKIKVCGHGFPICWHSVQLHSLLPILTTCLMPFRLKSLTHYYGGLNL
jgi:hypothetical protein